jgi:hypothetical protein
MFSSQLRIATTFIFNYFRETRQKSGTTLLHRLTTVLLEGVPMALNMLFG